MLSFIQNTIMNDNYVKNNYNVINVTVDNYEILFENLYSQDYLILVRNRPNIIFSQRFITCTDIFLPYNYRLKLNTLNAMPNMDDVIKTFWFYYDFYEENTEFGSTITYTYAISKKYINYITFSGRGPNITIHFKDDRFQKLSSFIPNNKFNPSDEEYEAYIIDFLTKNLDFNEKAIIYKKLEEAGIL